MNAEASCPQMEPVPRRSYGSGDLLAGRYRLSQKAAVGGMGEVWIARNLALDVPIAIKVLHQDPPVCAEDRASLGERLCREARAAATVRHPAIVKTFDFGFDEWDDPYIAMELLEGESLGDLLAREQRLSPERAVQIMLPIADGLVAAHGLGIVHRDLKPDNIFLAKEHRNRIQPKIVDFGIAKVTSIDTSTLPGAEIILGTPHYMAPEQGLEVAEADERADVWSYCVVLYEAISGTVPFPGECFLDVFSSMAKGPAPSLLAMGLDRALWTILERGLTIEKDERWKSMHELGKALSEWLLSRGIAEDVTGSSLRVQWSIEEAAGRADEFIVPIEWDPASSTPALPSVRAATGGPKRSVEPAARKRRRRSPFLARSAVAGTAAFWIFLGQAPRLPDTLLGVVHRAVSVLSQVGTELRSANEASTKTAANRPPSPRGANRAAPSAQAQVMTAGPQSSFVPSSLLVDDSTARTPVTSEP